jgi:hypothetical protein
MKVRKLDSLDDWTFGSGLSGLIKDQGAIEQNLKTRLSSWLGDCFWAMQDGIDYKALLDKGQEDTLTLAIKSVILATQGIVGITSLSVSLSAAREYTISCTIDTIYGQNYTVTSQG